jgi:5,10-methylenetetrahydromethanopterin reductase
MPASVNITLRIPGTAPMPVLLSLIQEVEAAGFHGAGILDSQLLCRDPYVTMALAAGRDIPVLMAASGPKAIALAGEVADGVLLLVGYTPGIAQAVLACLEQGAQRSGRRLDDLEIVWAVRLGTASTTAEARRQARPIAVHWGILGWGGYWLKDAGLQIPTFAIPPAVRDIYPDLSHASNWEEAIAATSFVPDEVIAPLCDALGLIGTPEYCAQRLMDMAAAGMTNLYLMPFQTFVGPEQEVRAFREVVFPHLRAAGYL